MTKTFLVHKSIPGEAGSQKAFTADFGAPFTVELPQGTSLHAAVTHIAGADHTQVSGLRFHSKRDGCDYIIERA
jgi:hypothetical protein